MIYISKGIAGKGSTTELVQVARGGNEVQLSDKDERYWILARCVCCPAKGAKRSFGLAAGEKNLLFWLVHAGIRLSTAELVYLREHKIKADSRLLHPGNRQALVEMIYTAGTIADNLLENRMAAAECRDSVVRDILSLLKKKKLLIL